MRLTLTELKILHEALGNQILTYGDEMMAGEANEEPERAERYGKLYNLANRLSVKIARRMTELKRRHAQSQPVDG